ncbi:MAG: hypothetical protein ABFD94_22865, partial [Armatimonadia bacterium]
MHRNIIPSGLILIALMAATAAAWGQEWEVRTFLSQTGNPDDPTCTDGTGTSTASYQYLQSNIKARWVCPFCSFSRAVGGNCPNPWNVAGHPTVALLDLGSTLRHRLLSITGQDMPDDKFDLNIVDIGGVLHPRAILGRPFKPFDLDTVTNHNQRRSRLYAQAANLVSTGSPITAGMHLRFMVIPPTPLRREAQTNDPTGQDNGLPNRRPMAQVRPYDATDAATTATDDPATTVNEQALDLADDSWLQLLDRAGNAQDITPADLPNFLEVGLNPYRVDDGDYWWVRYREEAVDMGGGVIEVRRAAVEVYSVMYGWQGQLVSGAKAELLVAPAWDDANGNGTVDAGEADVESFDVVVPSGAVRLRFHTPFSGAASPAGGWNTWTMGFMTRSNCRMIPGWQDMAAVDDSDFPQFRGLDGVQYGDSGFKLAEDDPTTNDQFGPATDAVKTPSFAAASGTGPTITTETDIEGAAGTPQGYVLPPNTTGMGTIAVQWAGDLPGDAEWDPDPTVAASAGTVFTLRAPAHVGDTTEAVRDTPYAEWQYDTGENVTNAEIMSTQVNNYTAASPYVRMMAARFMCTKPDVLPTGDNWDRNADGTGDEAAEANNLDAAYPKAFIGWLGSGLVRGSFAPGGTTPQRPLDVVNRWDGLAETQVCTNCGGLWADHIYPLASEALPQGLQQTDLPSNGQCPYHMNPAFVTVTGAGSADYNGTYYQEGTFNAQPVYVLDSGHVLYYKGSRWTLAASTASQDAYRTQSPKAPLNAGITWQKRPAGNTPAPSAVVRSVTGSATRVSSPVGGGGFTAREDTWRAITATGHDERQASLPDKRHVLPGQAVVGSGVGVGYASNYATAQPEQLSVSIPRYQPPSVPGTGVVNNFGLDQGYRGGQVLYHNIDAPNANSPMTDGWDVFYKNPDNGYFQPRAGEWPFLVNGSVVFAASAPAGSTPAEGRHFYCAVCGSEFRNNPSNCPFDGHTIAGTDQIPYNLAVRDEHLVAEEYDPFDLQVSVARKGELTQTTEDVPVGRVTPGVPSRQPDLNTGVLTNHRAFPSDVSFVPRSPYRASEAKVLLRNEGNVQTPLRLANVYDLDDAAITDRALDHYLRVDVDPTSSYARKAGSGPLTRDTFVPRTEGDLGLIYENAMNTAAAWNTLATEPGSAAGNEAYGYVSAGSYVGRGTPKPVPLGQPVGTYLGSQLQYVDAIANGAFDFSYWDGSAWVDTTTAARQYNPAIDLAREPLTGVLRGQSRVFEARLPQNDYYSRDSDPVVLPSPQPGRMQVLWSTNRLATSAASPSGAVGTNQGDIPSPTAASNLVYATPRGYIDVADDPVFRRYVWPADPVSGILDLPELMTADSGTVVNGAPWVMYDVTGATKWAFWQRQQRHAGGVDSRLIFNSVAADTWTWPAVPAANFVYDTGLMKQGLRGFARTNGAWLFWHAGTPGREQLNYRWDFTGTPNNNQALLPVSSAMGAGTTDLATAVLPGGVTNVTIRRPKSGPFTSTKDVSVFNTGTTAHVFFSGFITHEGQADICWTQYRINDPIPAGAAGPLSKLPFRRAMDDEEMATDGFHQLFGSRHLDWQVGQHFAAGSGDPDSPLYDGFSPTFELRMSLPGTAVPVRRFKVTWSLAVPSADYDRAVADYRNRGVYRVTPTLTGLTNNDTLPADYAVDLGGGKYGPLAPGSGGRRLMMDINPVAGTVQFGSPLFDEDTPGNPRTVFGDDAARDGLENLRNVVLCINYNAYVYRVTRNGAQDDCPSASWDDATQRLVVFWRRSYPTSEAPHFGRPAFMYKAYSTSVQVGRPPVASWDSVTGNTAAYVTANNPGILTADPADIDRYLTINYTSADGRSYSERHQVIGWSREMVVPVDTVVGEGSLVAVPEQFNVPATDPADPAVLVPAVRYWLFWSSPRGVWDMRLVENPAG